MRRARQIPLARRTVKRAPRPAIAAVRWRPPTLTWRKLGRSILRQLTPTNRWIAHTRFSPRFSLHLSLASILSMSGRRLARTSASGRATVRRDWIERVTSLHRLLRSFVTGTESRRLIERTTREVATRTCPVPASHRLQVRTIFQTQRLASRVRSPNRTNSERRRTAYQTRSSVLTAATSVHLRRRTFGTDHVVAGSVAAQHADLVLARTLPSPRAVLARPPQLVWRNEPQPYPLEAIERSITAATAAAAPFSGVSAPRAEPMNAPHGLSPSGKIDPALIDRVAEDVIGRVERRIRIERERRGI